MLKQPHEPAGFLCPPVVVHLYKYNVKSLGGQ